MAQKRRQAPQERGISPGIASMKRINWHRQHRWSGIASAIFMLIFCISGIILNHPDRFAPYEISRGLLPSRYRFHKWNGGLLRGSIAYGDSVMLYGLNGIWLCDASGGRISDFNVGLPPYAKSREIRNVIESPRGHYALTPSALFTLAGGRWHEVPLRNDNNERLTDIATRGDTIVVLGRSHIYVSPAAGQPFIRRQLPHSPDADPTVSLFRTVWMLHSGLLMEPVGRIAVDCIAAVLILLSLTGLVHILMPRHAPSAARAWLPVQTIKLNLTWHNRLGRYTILFTTLMLVSGWCLRPPLMIPLVMTRTAPLPDTSPEPDNQWNDKLRMLRFDEDNGVWLLHTTEGFYELHNYADTPRKLETPVPVSVMGLNVFHKENADEWLCGSFSGLYLWNRATGTARDYFTGEPAGKSAPVAIGGYAAAGYSPQFHTPVEYFDGTDALPQPGSLRNLPMPIWNVALEAHSGRLFIGQAATYAFIFLTGATCLWCLVSGWKARVRKRAQNCESGSRFKASISLK